MSQHAWEQENMAFQLLLDQYQYYMLEISIYNNYGKVIQLIVFNYFISNDTNVECHKRLFSKNCALKISLLSPSDIGSALLSEAQPSLNFHLYCCPCSL